MIEVKRSRRLNKATLSFVDMDFDVAVVNPASDFYVHTQHSDTRDLAAAKNIEKRKTAHYVKLYGEAFRTQIRPLVLEATEAFGPIACAILKKMANQILAGVNQPTRAPRHRVCPQTLRVILVLPNLQPS
jgi:hypothetical protein